MIDSPAAEGGPAGRAIAAVCKAVMGLTTAGIFVILCSNTVLRYATGASLDWGNEVPELAFPWLVMAGVVLAAQRGAHIATTFLVEALPDRMRRRLVVAVWLTVAAMHATLAVATAQLLPIVHGERSPILKVPGSLTYGCVLIGLALLALLALQSALRTWRAPPRPSAASAPASPASG
jgi:TRAP-type C4-dicarboxylate transport system permease small subunit